MSEQVVPVYTRLEANRRDRKVMFPIPPEIDQIKLLEMGFAIDGRDALFTVEPGKAGGFSSVGGGEWHTWTRALWATQRLIATYLNAKGFKADFK